MFFIAGILLGAGVIALAFWVRQHGVKVRWFEWLLGIVGLGLILFVLPNLSGSFREHEPTAGWMFALLLGLPGVLLTAIAVRLVMGRREQTIVK